MESHIKSHSENSNTNSGSSTTSDKEYLTSSSPQSFEDSRDLRYFSQPEYLPPVQYGASGVELLAAAASVTEESLTNPADVINLIATSNRRISSPQLIRHPAYFTSAPTQPYDPSLDAGNDIRRRVEAALAVASNSEVLLTPPNSNPVSPEHDIRQRVEAALAVASNEPLLTPPSSNPVSPASSTSPDPIPIELIATRQVISLPPRKRSKMILKSMESEVESTVIRHSSVIHYAKAS